MGISTGEVATASDVLKLETLCHIVTVSRSSGDFANSASIDYTGFGFQPTGLIIHSFANNNLIGWGLYASNAQFSTDVFNASVTRAAGKIISLQNGTTVLTASVTSVGSTGVTIFWASAAGGVTVHADILGIGDTY